VIVVASTTANELNITTINKIEEIRVLRIRAVNL
jgi:hypothetical protein